MVILVSKCLLGYACRYKGDGCECGEVLALGEDNVLIPVCPEVMGGLPTPRDPSERIGDKVVSVKGRDVTAEYTLGAQKALQIAQESHVDVCVMKARSPSCGCGMIYDGSFTGSLTNGDGVTVELLKAHGYTVVTEEDVINGYFNK